MVYVCHKETNERGETQLYVRPESFRTYEGADQYRHAQIENPGWLEDKMVEAYVEPVTNYQSGNQWGRRKYLRGPHEE